METVLLLVLAASSWVACLIMLCNQFDSYSSKRKKFSIVLFSVGKRLAYIWRQNGSFVVSNNLKGH